MNPAAGAPPTRCVGESGRPAPGAPPRAPSARRRARRRRCPGPRGRRGRGSGSCGARRAGGAPRRAAAPEDAMELLRGVTIASGCSQRAARPGGSAPAHGHRELPAAFAARMSKGESPTYAASAGSRRVASAPRGSARDRACGARCPPRRSSRPRLAEHGKRSRASPTVRSRFAVTMPSRRPSARSRAGGRERRRSLELRVQRLVVGAIGLDELVDAVGAELAHLRVRPGPPIAARPAPRRLAAEHGHATHAASRRG